MKMAITEISVIVACPDGIHEKMEEALKSVKLADAIAAHLSNEVDTEQVAVELN